MPAYSLKVNGRTHTVEVPADMPLLWVLRDRLGLTGTKYGCGQGLCGSCTVHVDGDPVRSCQLPMAQLGEAAVTTIYDCMRVVGIASYTKDLTPWNASCATPWSSRGPSSPSRPRPSWPWPRSRSR